MVSTNLSVLALNLVRIPSLRSVGPDTEYGMRLLKRLSTRAHLSRRYLQGMQRDFRYLFVHFNETLTFFPLALGESVLSLGSPKMQSLYLQTNVGSGITYGTSPYTSLSQIFIKTSGRKKEYIGFQTLSGWTFLKNIE